MDHIVLVLMMCHIVLSWCLVAVIPTCSSQLKAKSVALLTQLRYFFHRFSDC